MSEPFGEYARYYDLLYADKNYAAEADYLCRLLNRFRPASAEVLELGGGTGRHAEELAKRKLSVTCVERSDEMIAAAKKRIPQATLISADARTVRLGRQYDAVLALFHVLSYQTRNDDVTAFFQTAAEHLVPGGLFLFDLWYGPAVLSQLPEPRTKKIENDSLSVQRTATPQIDINQNVVQVDYEVQVEDRARNRRSQIQETHPMRYFFSPEIELFADACGLRVVHCENWLDGLPLSERTWNATFVAQQGGQQR